jgi:hypothetical protein
MLPPGAGQRREQDRGRGGAAGSRLSLDGSGAERRNMALAASGGEAEFMACSAMMCPLSNAALARYKAASPTKPRATPTHRLTTTGARAGG